VIAFPVILHCSRYIIHSLAQWRWNAGLSVFKWVRALACIQPCSNGYLWLHDVPLAKTVFAVTFHGCTRNGYPGIIKRPLASTTCRGFRWWKLRGISFGGSGSEAVNSAARLWRAAPAVSTITVVIGQSISDPAKAAGPFAPDRSPSACLKAY
jgi:hypothetical protein